MVTHFFQPTYVYQSKSINLTLLSDKILNSPPYDRGILALSQSLGFPTQECKAHCFRNVFFMWRAPEQSLGFNKMGGDLAPIDILRNFFLILEEAT